MNKVLLAVALLSAGFCFGQNKRICILGSSTSYGYGVPQDSSYAGRVKKYYKDLNIIDTMYNFGTSGTDCYMAMPSSYVPPPGRNAPNASMNITRAVNLVPKPDVIIVNFPSNNYQWMPYSEVIFCLQTIKDSANANGIACYITTTQPRDDFSIFGTPVSERQRLKDLKALIEQNFGTFSIDFWSDIVQDPPIVIKPELALGDNVHLNPRGHAVLAQKVIDKNFFFTTVACRFGDIEASLQQSKVYLRWSAWCSNEIFSIQRSTDGIHFTGLFSEAENNETYHLKSQLYMDERPALGKNFYRVLSRSSSGLINYSPVVMVDSKPQALGSKVFPTVFTEGVNVSLHYAQKQEVELLLTDSRGIALFRQRHAAVLNKSFFLPLPKTTQAYFLKIKTAVGTQVYPLFRQ